jgi:hypothetical protein
VGKVCGFGLRFLHKERAHLFSLSLLLSSGICLALGGGERLQREREREGDGGVTVYARKSALFLSLSLWCEISLAARLSLTGE